MFAIWPGEWCGMLPAPSLDSKSFSVQSSPACAAESSRAVTNPRCLSSAVRRGATPQAAATGRANAVGGSSTALYSARVDVVEKFNNSGQHQIDAPTAFRVPKARQSEEDDIRHFGDGLPEHRADRIRVARVYQARHRHCSQGIPRLDRHGLTRDESLDIVFHKPRLNPRRQGYPHMAGIPSAPSRFSTAKNRSRRRVRPIPAVPPNIRLLTRSGAYCAMAEPIEPPME
jgi:hypothetical protein